ncbi:hypothetical protein MPTK1_7g12940 [Marchantia polymorpha subsp. ruderalis]|uniref:Uncharacterized protein n=2 Tax=Marchantia polymorpha TaxID=3197 RepID=A0AAF6BYZ6_MARPO|nr:hypothetical protein MARPO_0003s0302 [Marchantia polymorpha]BBN17230.1 hypothetical protein Mp_7g12940 [Marchantia polymorpha subsp. ruderalis]|eukprot:PTQ49465.1 hypothetical protein MARPO_0003s0302 [Marchantia polymorpha]
MRWTYVPDLLRCFESSPPGSGLGPQHIQGNKSDAWQITLWMGNVLPVGEFYTEFLVSVIDQFFPTQTKRSANLKADEEVDRGTIFPLVDH